MWLHGTNGLWLALALASGNDPVATARFSLDLASAEVGACCADRVEDAPLATQRRWAYGLYRWLAETDTQPDWSTLREPEVLERQMLRLDPEYVATVAVHGEAWLSEVANDLPKPSSRNLGAGRQWFTQSLWALAALELDLVAAGEKREREMRQVQASYEAVATEVTNAKRQARIAAREAHLAERPFVAATAFTIKRASLDRAIAEQRAEINRLQQEFWAYEAEWKGRRGESQPGSSEQAAQLLEYRTVAEEYNKQVQSLTDTVVAMSRRRDQLSFSEVRSRLDEIERPSAARPVPFRDVTPAEAGGAVP